MKVAVHKIILCFPVAFPRVFIGLWPTCRLESCTLALVWVMACWGLEVCSPHSLFYTDASQNWTSGRELFFAYLLGLQKISLTVICLCCVYRIMHDEVSDTENIRKNLAIERMIVEGCDILLDTSQTFIRQGKSLFGRPTVLVISATYTLPLPDPRNHFGAGLM